MKRSPLIGSITLSLLISTFWACTKDACFDMAQLDFYSAEISNWYVNDSIESFSIIDNNGISQTLQITGRDLRITDKSAYDDCGNSFGSSYYSISYKTSVSPISLTVYIMGSALDDGFHLRLNYNRRIEPIVGKETVYDFVTKQSRDNVSEVEYLENFQVNEHEFSDVLEITFSNTSFDNEVKAVYFAKGFGIVKFVTQNGSEFGIK